MAETSGFFEAIQDEQTGVYDREYFASQFAAYFSLFVGNGVFGSPTNQLKVSVDEGLRVKVSPGWGFINGYWYNNSSVLTLPVPSNATSESRVDSVRLRWNNATRSISLIYVAGSIDVIRDGAYYDLKLAEIIVPAVSTQILESNVTDTRTNEEVCGFVTSLLKVQTTADLFAQYQAMFEEWFETVKGQVSGDLAIHLQQEFDELNQNVISYQEEVLRTTEEYQQATERLVAEAKESAEDAKEVIENFVAADFTIPKQTLTFTNKRCVIEDERITANSLIDVYFTAETMKIAETAQIYVDSEAGKIVLSASIQPTASIEALMRVRVM